MWWANEGSCIGGTYNLIDFDLGYAFIVYISELEKTKKL